MGPLGVLHSLTRNCLTFTGAFRQRGLLDEDGAKSKRPPALHIYSDGFKSHSSSSKNLAASAGKAAGSSRPPSPPGPRLRPTRREQLLAAVLLVCLAQISWMRHAQANALIMWVRESVIEEAEPGQPTPRHAVLPALQVLAQSPDECAEALRIPRVALMFLTTGILYHEDTWRMWFRSAGGVLPSQVVAESVCNSDGVSKKVLAGARACKRNATNAVTAQHLFSVYIHAPPDFEGYDDDSLWAGRLVQHRVTTSWGAHTLVEATRHLLWEAFRDPLNTRFLLMSESDIPLYDPLTLYQQLQAETVSRLDTCKHQTTSQWRWDPRMETPRLKFHMWRKSPQWLAMPRSHVEVVLRDEEVYRKFERHCWSAWDEGNRRWHRDCFSDEHYFATLLATEGRDEEGVCESRGVSYTEWTDNSAHPKTFPDAFIDRELIRRARAAPASSTGAPTPPCDWAAAQAAAAKLFVPTSEALGAQSVEVCGAFWRKPPSFDAKMPDTCFLTARKFPWEVRDRVRAVFLQCSGGAGLLRHDVCVAEGGSTCGALWQRIKGSFSRDPC